MKAYILTDMFNLLVRLTGRCGCLSQRFAPFWLISLSELLVAPPPSSQRKRRGSLSRGTERRWRGPWRPQQPPSSPSGRQRAFNPTAAAWAEPPSPPFLCSLQLQTPAQKSYTSHNFQGMQFTFPPLIGAFISTYFVVVSYCGLLQ